MLWERVKAAFPHTGIIRRIRAKRYLADATGKMQDVR